MYQILYVVRASSLTLDSRLVVGLSSVQVSEALDTTVHAVLNIKYSDLIVANLANVFLYETRFTLDFAHGIHFVRGIHVRRLRFKFCSTSVNPFEHGCHASLCAGDTHIPF